MYHEATETLAYLWQTPGKPVSVSLSLAVVDELGDAVLKGGDSPVPRGLEIGGLLLGKARRNRGRTFVEVDSFVPVECEHLVGPSYLLSPSDRKHLAERIRRHKHVRGRTVVGFYRSNTRKDSALTKEDLDLMAAYLPEPSMVFLLVQGHREAPPTARFAIREGRDVASMKLFDEFPFSSAALIEGHAVHPRTVAAPSLPLFAHGVALWAAAARFVRWRPSRKTFQLPRALRNPEKLKLGWLAAGAFLAAAIVTGAFLNGLPETGSVPLPQPVAQERKAPIVNEVVPTALEPVTPVISVPGAETLPVATPPAATGESTEERARVASTIAVVSPAPPEPSVPSAPPDAALLPDPPEIPARLPGDAEPLSTASEILEPRIPPLRDPFVSIAFEPLPRSDRRGPFSKFPLVSKGHPRTEFVAPKPISEARPEVSTELRQRIRQEVSIDVKLYVDRAGKVEFAELLSNGTGVNRDLASMAVFSSRHWEFSPARLGDKTVPAEVVLRFRFGPALH